MRKNTKIPYAELEIPPGDSTRAATTGEFRAPRKGEWYASGAIVEAYQAPNDLKSSYWICVPAPYTPEKQTLELAMKIGDQKPPIHKNHGTI
jgi:hypothetical protein